MQRILAAAVVLAICPALVAQPATFAPGRDYWVCAQPSALTFSSDGDGLPPVPEDFFYPGCLPFEGTVYFSGAPASPSLPFDTIIERTGAASLDTGQSATVPIEILALDLRSTAPIPAGPWEWDVIVSVDPDQPSGGSARITRTHDAGGLCGYSLQFTPRIRFLSTDGTMELTYPFAVPVTIETVLDLGIPRFTKAPQGPVLPLQGPGFFPIDPIASDAAASTPGVRFAWTPPFHEIVDCNGNGEDDTIDILLGHGRDANANGRIDSCETVVTHAYQDSFPDEGTGWLQRYSSRGELRVSLVDPPEDEVWWLSVAIPGRWIIYNFPVHEQTGEGKTTEHTVPFDLGNTPGQPVVDIEIVELRLTSSPLPIPMLPVPPDPIMPTLPVQEHVLRLGRIADGLPLLPVRPMLGQDFVFFDADGNPKEIARKRDVPGVSESTNECGPGAAARSLAWLNSQYCLGLNQTPETMRDDLSFEMNYSDPAGVPNVAAMLNGAREVLTQYGLNNRLTAELCEADGVNDDDEVFDALQRGCDVVGVIYFLNADGSDRLSHAVTVLGGSRCGDRVVISFADDCHGGDAQGDGMPDDPAHVKGAALVPRSATDPRLHLPGYGDNRWAGFMKICPTAKVQADAADKWNTQASGTPAGGLHDLIESIQGGAAVTDADRMNLLSWACNLVDSLQFASRSIAAGCHAPGSLSIALELLGRARHAKAAIWVYLRSRDPDDLDPAAAELGDSFDAFVTGLLARLDCNMNGIDDALEIARGDARDANHDCVIDTCQCLADWNADGVVNVPDIFAFLAAWFGGDADVNGDGVTTVPDIFAFLALWFANCPD